ncbi:SoxR reducing system RseC family protein [Endozoicomonas montiporae]|uniref:Sigma-E factor negative regulatory protein RseC n=1 Tax=Endozoicomonas montiporae CL-33 TaxID=570277 RepID=A0A142BDY1_9GAMM|nr:SoxR reducing system RseC family protein [Endozoicomonas montiporae]AMO56957.1 sigma-E factor negative regulatory protein RseC [Endozoicomonas montiporae CL-33]
MIEEHGRVVAVEGDAIWVETIRKTTCSGCSAKNGCGQHLAEKYKSSKTHSYIRASNASGSSIKEHDEVTIGIPENALMKASMVVYLLPLLSMMAGLFLGSFLAIGDLWTMLLSLSGLVAGFLPVRMLGQKAGDMCHVQVLKVTPRQLDEPELVPLRPWVA